MEERGQGLDVTVNSHAEEQKFKKNIFTFLGAQKFWDINLQILRIRTPLSFKFNLNNVNSTCSFLQENSSKGNFKSPDSEFLQAFPLRTDKGSQGNVLLRALSLDSSQLFS